MMSSHVVWHDHSVSKAQRSLQKDQKPCILWFTGLSGSGKSTIANALDARFVEMGKHTYLLDGDNIRHGLNCDLGFSDNDRIENIRRIGEVSKLFVNAGLIVITTFISPFQADRKMVRELVDESEFIEIFIDTTLDICELRDTKGLYKRARVGEIVNFTGIDSPYEPPNNPEIHIKTEVSDITEAVEKILAYLVLNGWNL